MLNPECDIFHWGKMTTLENTKKNKISVEKQQTIFIITAQSLKALDNQQNTSELILIAIRGNVVTNLKVARHNKIK